MYKSAALILLFFLQTQLLPAQHYRTAGFALGIDDHGRVTSLVCAGHDYVPRDSPGVLLQIVVQGQTFLPLKAAFGKGTVTLSYGDGRTAGIAISEKPSYITFKLTAVSKNIDAVKWGPFNTTIADTIGNTVGVVRSPFCAIGLQCLNKKTTGGGLVNDEGAVFGRGTTAIATGYGSSLQAFSVNRSVDRKIRVWDRWPEVPVKAMPDGVLTGSSIAVFGCTPANVLGVIGEITRKEGLPMAQWQEQWIKESPESGRPYMITTFSEADIDTFLTCARRMGMAAVYHEDPFETWGHFVLKKALFPHGVAGFRACVAKAHAMGLRLGFHSLSTFITTNDSYVSPKPDPRLAQAGSGRLLADISADATEIPVDSDRYFRLRSDLNTVRIGTELIRYMSITPKPPFRLAGCQRGAFGTEKKAHRADEPVGRLIDHPYKVFFPDWELQKEVAANLAGFINETGADQMDFDGHEGTYATGMGDLSFNTFAEDVFRMAGHPVVFGSSRDNHYFWHFNNYLNWGEPWYGGFRESQQDVRIANQKFYQDNYLPHMLGWFLITASTGPDDIDWMLARAAGYQAGYALVVRKEALSNPNLEEIIDRIQTWTAAQRRQRFTAEQCQWLENTDHDAHLDTREGKLYLQRFRKYDFTYQARVLQPGQPTSQSWEFDNGASRQIPQLVISVKGDDGKIDHPTIDIDNSFHLVVPATLNRSETLVLGSGDVASLYDRKGRLIQRIPLDRHLPELDGGNHTLTFDGATDVNSAVTLAVQVRLLDKEEALK